MGKRGDTTIFLHEKSWEAYILKHAVLGRNRNVIPNGNILFWGRPLYLFFSIVVLHNQVVLHLPSNLCQNFLPPIFFGKRWTFLKNCTDPVVHVIHPDYL